VRSAVGSLPGYGRRLHRRLRRLGNRLFTARVRHWSSSSPGKPDLPFALLLRCSRHRSTHSPQRSSCGLSARSSGDRTNDFGRGGRRPAGDQPVHGTSGLICFHTFGLDSGRKCLRRFPNAPFHSRLQWLHGSGLVEVDDRVELI